MFNDPRTVTGVDVAFDTERHLYFAPGGTMEDPKDVLRKAWREMNITSIEYHLCVTIVDQLASANWTALSTRQLGHRLKKPTALLRKSLRWMEAAGIVKVHKDWTTSNDIVWLLAIRPISG